MNRSSHPLNPPQKTPNYDSNDDEDDEPRPSGLVARNEKRQSNHEYNKRYILSPKTHIQKTIHEAAVAIERSALAQHTHIPQTPYPPPIQPSAERFFSTISVSQDADHIPDSKFRNISQPPYEGPGLGAYSHALFLANLSRASRSFLLSSSVT